MRRIFKFHRRVRNRPPYIRDGQVAFAVPERLYTKQDEVALTIHFISDRKLFGAAYWDLQPDYANGMPQDAGLFICPLVPTRQLITNAVSPGDIDVLVIPYEGDRLVLHRVLAIEVKTLRARFARQDKSPNEFGISQATALLSLGFPYVAVAHLIVSDQSPSQSEGRLDAGGPHEPRFWAVTEAVHDIRDWSDMCLSRLALTA